MDDIYLYSFLLVVLSVMTYLGYFLAKKKVNGVPAPLPEDSDLLETVTENSPAMKSLSRQVEEDMYQPVRDYKSFASSLLEEEALHKSVVSDQFLDACFGEVPKKKDKKKSKKKKKKNKKRSKK